MLLSQASALQAAWLTRPTAREEPVCLMRRRHGAMIRKEGAMKGRGRMTVRRRGFALLAVLWGLAATAMMVTPFLSTSRLRLQTAVNFSAATKAAYIADAATTLAYFTLLAEFWGGGSKVVHDGAPLVCTLDGATVGIAIEDESGKIDLNNASRELIAAALAGLGLSADAAGTVAGAVLAYRSPPDKVDKAPSPAKPFPPKGAPFETALELDQVEGVTPQLFRAFLPFVTVHSFRPGVNVASAPPALFAALAGYAPEDVQTLLRTPFPNRLNRQDLKRLSDFLSYMQGVGGDTFTIHVEVVLPDGQTSARENIVDLDAQPQAKFRIVEVRRRPPRRWGDLSAFAQTTGQPPPCG